MYRLALALIALAVIACRPSSVPQAAPDTADIRVSIQALTDSIRATLGPGQEIDEPTLRGDSALFTLRVVGEDGQARVVRDAYVRGRTGWRYVGSWAATYQ